MTDGPNDPFVWILLGIALLAPVLLVVAAASYLRVSSRLVLLGGVFVACFGLYVLAMAVLSAAASHTPPSTQWALGGALLLLGAVVAVLSLRRRRG